MSSWADKYAQHLTTADRALHCIQPGHRVFIGSSCGEPQHLVRALYKTSLNYTDIEIVRLMALESTPLTKIADQTHGESMTIRSFYAGSAKPRAIARNQRFITPINLSAVSKLFVSGRLPIQVALIQVSPPDDFGWMSLGISVDITLAAALSADVVIAQVNPRMPRVLGRSFLHVNDVQSFVEHEEPLLSIAESPVIASANKIAEFVAPLVDDGATIQISPGATLQATLRALSKKNDLGIHTQYLTDSIMHLYAQGVITNRKKGLNDGKLVASAALGTPNLYEFLNDNPGIEFHPSDYVHDPSIIARHHKMVSMNVPMAMDLTGQVAADALPYNMFSGVTGILDFVRGATQGEAGKSILMLPATSTRGEISRIVPYLDDTVVVVPRSDVQYVVTEYGAVNLFGKSLQERAMAMITIAHPKFRQELFQNAKQMGLLGAEHSLTESLYGVYPVKLQETFEIMGQPVTIRPSKPVDVRRIQEHFYNLDKTDVVARFFHEKSSFVRSEVGSAAEVDYVKNLTVLAVVGDFGFGRVVGIGEYLLDPSLHLAEIAFSISKSFQGQGLGLRLLKKLTDAALENEIAGFVAYTSTKNQGMISLFKKLPYEIETLFEGEILTLKCKFDKALSK